MELPEPLNLSQLRMNYNSYFFDYNNFCVALKKLPKLENLELNADVEQFLDDHYCLRLCGVFKIVCDILCVVATQKKDVVVKHSSPNSDYKHELRITNKSESFVRENRMLNLMVFFEDLDQNLFKSVKGFVESNLQSYYAVIDKSEEV